MSIEQFIEDHQELKKITEDLLASLKFVRERITEECSDPYILDTVEQMDEVIAEAEKIL